MSFNPNSPQEPSDQYSNKQGWLSNEFGLQPLNAIEKVLKHLIKAFAYQFGWDETNLMWRAIRSDVGGNLKTTSGTQGTLPPSISLVNLTTAYSEILAANPNRSYFTVYNNSFGPDLGGAEVLIQYPNPNSSEAIHIPPGTIYTDTNWSGAINGLVNGINTTTQSIIITEYN